MIDTHAHLDDEQFDGMRAAVVRRARDAGVVSIVAVGTTASSSRAVVDLASRFDGVYAAVGIQPNHCGDVASGDWDRVIRLADENRVVAIGETGLDRYWDFTPFDIQQDYFDRHLRLSQENGLPFIVHMRDCEQDILSMLRTLKRLR